MNCSTVRAALPGLLYGHHEAGLIGQLEEHLTGCPACRRERDALQALRNQLDRLPVPAVRVDLPDLYRRAAEREQRRTRRWRRTTLAVSLAAAAVVLLSVGAHLQVRVEKHQLTLRWGLPAEVDVQAPPAPVPQGVAAEPAPLREERLRLLSDLIHALAADVEGRDRRQQEELARVQERVAQLQRQANLRLLTLERRLATMDGVQVTLFQKGPNP